MYVSNDLLAKYIVHHYKILKYIFCLKSNEQAVLFICLDHFKDAHVVGNVSKGKRYLQERIVHIY